MAREIMGGKRGDSSEALNQVLCPPNSDRVNFEKLPVFWRIDLNITSETESSNKWPSSFPEWPVATSAFWNIVWAVKRSKRGQGEADHYLSSACEKLGCRPVDYSDTNAMALLSELSKRSEVDKLLISKLEGEIMCQPSHPSAVDKPHD